MSLIATTLPAEVVMARRRNPEGSQLRAARMASLLLDDRAAGGRGAAEVVEWFGAMQAQDLASVKWSLGVRTGQDRSGVTSAFESGSILRTWPMRGTLHVVPGRDAKWMVAHLGRRARDGAQARRAVLGLDAAQSQRATEVLAEALADGQPATRAQCVAALGAAGIATDGQRAYHLLWYASACGVTCVGPNRGTEQTFALLAKWAPGGLDVDRQAALAITAERYFRSHGPATVHDLARWADLTVADARAGIAAAAGLVQQVIQGREMLAAEQVLDTLPAGGTPPARRPRLPARALPGFDEFVIGFRDRTAQLDAAHERLVVPGGNGVFAPTLVLDGEVVGTWRRRELSGRVEITAKSFDRLAARARKTITKALVAYSDYVGLPPDIRWENL
ncbi:MAG: winged helix DNA-binding domain-containing protein [Candidatus Nanopelagicales bacterium]